MLFGDEGDNTSGRLNVIRGYDAIKLNESYNNTYIFLCNRTKIKVEKNARTLGRA